jgi:hypothetical protein
VEGGILKGDDMWGIPSTRSQYKTIDDYAEHASNIRNRVVEEFDHELSKDEPSLSKIKGIVDIFRNFKYFTSDRLK